MRGAVHGLMDELIEAHAREHVAAPGLNDEQRQQGLEEVLEAIRRYAK
ncbi:metal-sensing transcriptional repressor [Acinetobacter baumannii]